MTIKSPFYVVEEFISPLLCEDMILRLENKFPNKDEKGKSIKTVRANKLSEIRVLPQLKEIIPDIEKHFGFEYLGLHPFDFEWYPTNFREMPPQCDNSNLVQGKWYRTNDKDFVGVIFLNDYKDSPPFDPEYEVVGGKLAFPNHRFSFIPKRGQLIIYPGSPHFVNATEKVLFGDLNQIKFYISAQEDYVYNPKNFPGSYKEWFK